MTGGLVCFTNVFLFVRYLLFSFALLIVSHAHPTIPKKSNRRRCPSNRKAILEKGIISVPVHSVHSSMYNPQNQMAGGRLPFMSLRLAPGQSAMNAGYQAGSAAYNPGMTNYTAYQSQQYMQRPNPQQTMGAATNQPAQGTMPVQQSAQQIRPPNPNVQKSQILAPYIVRPLRAHSLVARCQAHADADGPELLSPARRGDPKDAAAECQHHPQVYHRREQRQ